MVTAGVRGAVQQLRDAHGNARRRRGAVHCNPGTATRRRSAARGRHGRRLCAGRASLARGRGGGRSRAPALAAAVHEAMAAPVTTLGVHHHPLPRPTVEALDDGRVRVGFVATRVERLLLHVSVTGHGGGEMPLRGSPFSIDVHAGATSARRCEAFGEALHSAAVRQPTSFIVLARDAHGNRVCTGGDRFAVSFIGPCNPVARVHDRGDGTYRITYQAAVSGQCTMAVTHGRQHIAGSPFKLSVRRAERRN